MSLSSRREDINTIRIEFQSTIDELRPNVIKKFTPEDVAKFDDECRKIYETLEKFEHGFVWVAFFGQTGSGKSSIANSLIGGLQKRSSWKFVDVPGIFGETDNEKLAISEAKKADCLVFVITGVPFEPELKLFEAVHKAVPNTPVIVFVNKWDEMQSKSQEDRAAIHFFIEKRMRKFVTNSDDIVYGSAQIYDRKSDELVAQPLPQLIERMYANTGAFGDIVQVLDPANRQINNTPLVTRLYKYIYTVTNRLEIDFSLKPSKFNNKEQRDTDLKSPKRDLKVFLCHSSGDKSIVENFYDLLVKDGINAWLDKKSLIPGQNWQIEIPRVVRNSDVVIVFLSSQSVTKEGFVQKEIKIALDTADEKPDGTIFIIPAKLENCEVPERLAKFHWVNLYEKDGYELLFKALKTRASSLNVVINLTV